MIPIQNLLSRIRWDSEFGSGEFVIGYYDRIKKKIVKIPMKQIHVDRDSHYSFLFTDEEGASHTVPLHRIKEVYKDGRLIWHRTH